MMKPLKQDTCFWLLLLLCTATILPFLGISDFYSKGEPRESIVAFSMLHTGNWILPENNGGDIPYKPPFFHWLIALCSLVTGQVTEYSSRFPSAVAMIGMVMGSYAFFRRKSRETALLAALILFTAFEIHRAGVNARVDMVLTAATVGSLFALFKWWESGKKRYLYPAIVLMTAATLTKGPVGAVLPCMVHGMFLLLQGKRWWIAFIQMFAIGIAAFVLPLAWYYAAYQQGGDNFLNLVMEENFGRFLGKMTYESHEQPVYYNFITLAAGFLPWTLLTVPAVFAIRRRHISLQSVRKLPGQFRRLPSYEQYAWLAATIIFVFYCIPTSKRSVYIMPVYPFVAYGLARYFEWLKTHRPIQWKVYNGFLSALIFVAFVVFIGVSEGMVNPLWLGKRHVAENTALLSDLGSVSPLLWTLWLVPAVALWLWFKSGKKNSPLTACALTVALLVVFDGIFQPAVLKHKSVKPLAHKVAQWVPQGKIYSFKPADLVPTGNPEHFFGLNFYLNDRVKIFTKEMPHTGFLWMAVEDEPLFRQSFPGYQLTKVWQTTRQYDGAHGLQAGYRFTKIPTEVQTLQISK